MDGSRRAFDPETEQGCDPFSESIGLAKMEAAGNLKRGARRIVDHDRDDGIAIGLRNQSVEPYRTIFGPAFGPVCGNVRRLGHTELQLAITPIGQRLSL